MSGDGQERGAIRARSSRVRREVDPWSKLVCVDSDGVTVSIAFSDGTERWLLPGEYAELVGRLPTSAAWHLCTAVGDIIFTDRPPPSR